MLTFNYSLSTTSATVSTLFAYVYKSIPGPVFMSVGITYDGHISKPGITELKVGSSENWYSRVH